LHLNNVIFSADGRKSELVDLKQKTTYPQHALTINRTLLFIGVDTNKVIFILNILRCEQALTKKVNGVNLLTIK